MGNGQDNWATSASDWDFSSIAEFSSQLGSKGHQGAYRLFHFESEAAGLGALVSYSGVGMTAGVDAKFTNAGAKIAFEILDKGIAKPKLGNDLFSASLPRKKLAGSVSYDISGKHNFSMNDLTGASGALQAVGAGMAVGGSLQHFTALKNGRKLFDCFKLAAELGRLGVSATQCPNGFWWVLGVWKH